MKRLYVGILRRNSNGSNYFIRTTDDGSISIARLNCKSNIQSGSRVVIQGIQNNHVLDVDRMIVWPFPRKGSIKHHNSVVANDSGLPTAS